MNPFDSFSCADSSCSASRPHTVPPRSDDVLVSSTVFDTAGNPVTQTAADSVTTARTFDAADRLRVYNERRLQVRATSANASGSTILNEVAWGYNDFNQPTTEWQEHGGHATTASPKVQYTYASGIDNTIRPTGITYPDGTTTIATEDNYYWYDNLRQVTRHDRGNLTGTFPNYTGIDASTRQQKETFNFDETGNWNNTTAESPWLDQGRTHNAANQITSFAAPSGVVQPVFDAAGNMTVMPRPGAWDASLACTWDAWNRLVKVRSCSASSSSSDSSSSESSSSGPSSSWSSSPGTSSSSSALSSSESSSSDSSASPSGSSSSESPSSSSGSTCVDATYQYDALTRRVVTATAAETRHFYYSNQWRAVEESVSGAVKAQYVWNPADRWDLIRRKRPVTGAPDETRFVLRDYLDPAAIINESGTVTERYRYDAFGPVTVLAPDFSTRATSECGWNFLYHAEFIDALTGLYNYGYRFYHPNLGRWIARDPIEERGGLNLYVLAHNRALFYYDSLGNAVVAIEDGKRGITLIPTGGPSRPPITAEQIIADVKNKANKDIAPWMDTAAGEFGVTEDKDAQKCCPAIEKYNGSISPDWKEFMSRDEINAWRSCFAAWVLDQNGYAKEIPIGIKSIRARAYAECWCKTDRPVFGAMVIMHGPGTLGHVGFVAGVSGDGSEVIVIGGNQNDKVQPSRYNTKERTGLPKDGVTIVEYRYPCGEGGLPKNGQDPIDYSDYDVSGIEKKGETR